MNGITIQRQACLEAWINCETLLVGLATKEYSVAKRLEKVVDECALICMETWQAIKESSAKTKSLMLLCIGICEECAEVCERYNEAWFRQCATACRRCANSIAKFATASVYN